MRACATVQENLGAAILNRLAAPNFVDGKPTWELVDSKGDDLEAMKKCYDAELATYEKVGLVFRASSNPLEETAELPGRGRLWRKYIAIVWDYYRKNTIPEIRALKKWGRRIKQSSNDCQERG